MLVQWNQHTYIFEDTPPLRIDPVYARPLISSELGLDVVVFQSATKVFELEEGAAAQSSATFSFGGAYLEQNYTGKHD